MDFYLILALGPRNGLGYCVVNRHKVKGEIIIIIIIIRGRTVLIQKDPTKGAQASNYRPVTCLSYFVWRWNHHE